MYELKRKIEAYEKCIVSLRHRGEMQRPRVPIRFRYRAHIVRSSLRDTSEREMKRDENARSWEMKVSTMILPFHVQNLTKSLREFNQIICGCVEQSLFGKSEFWRDYLIDRWSTFAGNRWSIIEYRISVVTFFIEIWRDCDWQFNTWHLLLWVKFSNLRDSTLKKRKNI